MSKDIITDEELLAFYETSNCLPRIDQEHGQLLIISKKTTKTIRKINLQKARDFISKEAQ